MQSLNRFFLLVIALSAAATAAAVECRVVLPDGSALSGARVTVIGRSELLVADGDGLFELDPVPDLPFVLFIARPDGDWLAFNARSRPIFRLASSQSRAARWVMITWRFRPRAR